MQSQLEEIIKLYKQAKTSKESYEAISSFFKIVSECKDFISYAEEVGEDINTQKILINNDKGHDLSRKAKIKHDEERGRKSQVLHQLDPLFLLRNLYHVHRAIQSKNIDDNTIWIYKHSTPDESLSLGRKKEYLLYMEKTLQNIKPFLEPEISHLIPRKRVITPKEAIIESDFRLPTFDPEESVLCIDSYEVKIKVRKGNNISHDILIYIFRDNASYIREEHFYADIADEQFGDEYNVRNKHSHERYSKACVRINDNVSKKTEGQISDFLSISYSNIGSVCINKKYTNKG